MALFGSRSPEFTTGLNAVLGSGTYGVAYKVTHNHTEKVLKVVDLYKLARIRDGMSEAEKIKKTSEQQTKLMLEFSQARILSQNCSGIVRSELAWHEEPNFYILMEFCNGGTLLSHWEDVSEQLENREIVINDNQNENPFVLRGGFRAFGDTVPLEKIMSQVLEGLVFLEQSKVAHLDLKLDNVFVDAMGNVKIGDFGLVKSVTAKKGAVSTIDGRSYGTEGYMAPEIVKGQPTTTKADVYSFGVMLYQCVMMRPVEKTDPLPLRINERLWPNNGGRASLAQRMLAENPASRPFASEILAMLTVSQFPPPCSRAMYRELLTSVTGHWQSRGAPAPAPPPPAPRQVTCIDPPAMARISVAPVTHARLPPSNGLAPG